MDRDHAYLFDIMEAATLALTYIAGVTELEFGSNVQLQDSVIRRLEIVGEAARRVSTATRNQYPDIP